MTKKRDLLFITGTLAALIAGPRLIRASIGEKVREVIGGPPLAAERETETLAAPIPIRDHGKLTGLGDDDHSQYLLADGTREAAYLIITDGAGHYFQVPQLTTAQRDALSAVNGMIIYNTTTGQFERYEAGSWGSFGLGAHGAAQHTNVTRELFLPAAAGYVSNGNITSRGNYATVNAAAEDDLSVSFSLKVPDDFVSLSSVQAIWLSMGAAGNMYWCLNAHYAAAGEVYTLHSHSPALGVTANGGANIWNVQEPAEPLVLGSLLKGDYVGIFFNRDGDHANDTLDAVCHLLGLLITYEAEQ